MIGHSLRIAAFFLLGAVPQLGALPQRVNQFLEAPQFSTGSSPTSVVMADFNNDGKPDLAVTDSGFMVSILLGNGDGTFQLPVDYRVGFAPTSVVAADFNADGKLDLVVANYTGATVSVLLGNGDGTFQTHQDYTTADNPSMIAVGDVNRDGKLDLVVAAVAFSTGTPAVSVLLGNGDGTFQSHMDRTTSGVPSALSIGDFNDDGKPDIAATNSWATPAHYAYGSTVSIFQGNGDGTFQPGVDYGTGSYPTSVVAADFNKDGKLDLAVANWADHTVSLL